MKYKAIKKGGYGYCQSNNIEYVIENVDKYCGKHFDLYIDGVKVDNPNEYLEQFKQRKIPHTLEEKIVDMCYKIDRLEEENIRDVDKQILSNQLCILATLRIIGGKKLKPVNLDLIDIRMSNTNKLLERYEDVDRD